MVTALDKNTALVLIDFQKYIVGMPLAHPVGPVLEKAAALVAAFRKEGLPIVVVNVSPEGRWLQARKEPQPAPATTPGPDWKDIVPEIGAQSGDIFITKSHWSAFPHTTLHEQLQALGVTGIVFGGIATSIGVEASARDASVLGYNLTFATDAMTDMHLEAHDRSLQYIFNRMGETGDTAAIISLLADRV